MVLLLILPSSRYAFPFKLVSRIWRKIKIYNIYLISFEYPHYLFAW